MIESKEVKNNVLNLLVLGVAIILVLVAMKNQDYFVGKVPMVNIGNAPYLPMQFLHNGYPIEQPRTCQQIIYPEKVQNYNEIGRPCNGGCGEMGLCQDGVCKVKSQENTVFDIKI